MTTKALQPVALWQEFAREYSLTERQVDQFKRYYTLLKDTNELHNITAITNLQAVIRYHFADSLAVMQYLKQNKISSLADVGSGGGFPGLPLKIVMPELAVVLIEVSHKKAQFLQSVIDQLELTTCEISSYDWRTFLRKTDFSLELFCARASLQPQELVRMFKPSSPYKDATLVYWASEIWKPEPDEAQFLVGESDYVTGHKKRRLIYFTRTNHA